MSSVAVITQEMMDEFGKTSRILAAQVERVVGEITVDILMQNRSRFRKLTKTRTITVDTATKEYRLPVDFRTPKTHFIQVDSSGEFLKEIEIVSDEEWYRRKSDASYSGTTYARIVVNSGATTGEYLVLNTLPSATGFYEFSYYRIPKEDDSDIIENVGTIKEGVRSRFPQYIPNTSNHLAIYEKMKSGIKESPSDRSTRMVMRPSKRQSDINRRMFKIGRGQ